MKKYPRIGTLTFYNPERAAKSKVSNIKTMGLSIITHLLEEKGILSSNATQETAKHYDLLLISLYWWKDIYSLSKFIHDAGIDLSKKSPLVIVGGVNALNPWPIENSCNLAFIGDIEDVSEKFINAIEGKIEFEEVPGIFDFKMNKVEMQTASKLIPIYHKENRFSETVRIETARGCTNRCPFCVIGNYKPYIELPFESIKTILSSVNSKKIALFAPNRGGHSEFDKMQDMLSSKNITDFAHDMRLDHIHKLKNMNTSIFGIEGYSEKIRKAAGKNYSNDFFIDSMMDYFSRKTLTGNDIKTVYLYLIDGLPGSQDSDYQEFWDTLHILDNKLEGRKVNIFLSRSWFSPYYFTPLQWGETDVFKDYSAVYGRSPDNKLKKEAVYKNIVIAHRGGPPFPVRRLLQLLTIRGNKGIGKIIENIANSSKNQMLFKNKTSSAATLLLKQLEKHGFEKEYFYRRLNDNESLPWDMIESKTAPKEKLLKQWNRYKQKAGITEN